MDLAGIPDCRLEEQGVSFNYLTFTLTSGGEQKTLVRGVNFRPYEKDAAERITQGLQAELAGLGFDDSKASLKIEGGGTAAVNPYYETVTIFGENPEHGGESNRDAVLQLLKQVFSGYEVGSYQPGEEDSPPPKKKPVRKVAPKSGPTAPKPAAKPAPKPTAPEAPADADSASTDEESEDSED